MSMPSTQQNKTKQNQATDNSLVVSMDKKSEHEQVPLSVVEQFSGKHIFITGVTGFVGKVLLTLIAAKIPQVRKISVLIRSNRKYSSAKER